MKLLAVASLLFCSFCVDAASGRADENSVPTEARYQVDVSDDVIAALTSLTIQESARGMTDFSSRKNGQYVRVEYKITRYDFHYSKVDFYFDPDRTACFRREELLRCFAQQGFRKTTNHRSIEDKPFLFHQEEVLLRIQSDGSLKPISKCAYDECRELE